MKHLIVIGMVAVSCSSGILTLITDSRADLLEIKKKKQVISVDSTKTDGRTYYEIRYKEQK